jgi:hypothetical protein
LLNTKYNLSKHPYITSLQNENKYIETFSEILSCRKLISGYDINYAATSSLLKISYKGKEFGLKELKEAQAIQIDYENGGSGADILLNSSKVNYEYKNGFNIWTIQGTFTPFKHIRQIPQGIVDFKLFSYDIDRESYEILFEISANIIAHHNIDYEPIDKFFSRIKNEGMVKTWS